MPPTLLACNSTPPHPTPQKKPPTVPSFLPSPAPGSVLPPPFHGPLSSHCSESCHPLLTSSQSTLIPPTVFRNEPEWLTEEVPCACIASRLLEKPLEIDQFSL